MFGWHQQLNGHESEQTPGEVEDRGPCGRQRTQWKTEDPAMMQFMGSQITGHDLATEQQIYISSNLSIHATLFFLPSLPLSVSIMSILYSCPENRFICTVPLDPTYM